MKKKLQPPITEIQLIRHNKIVSLFNNGERGESESETEERNGE